MSKHLRVLSDAGLITHRSAGWPWRSSGWCRPGTPCWPPTPPIRREVLVPAGPDRAFEVFTARIGDWWPATRLATQDDQSVASGFFAVTVRPWRIVMAG
ncbi:MAG TPA: hypothetical protein VGH27_31910 [Streptosporangiaceae bacterium]